MIDENIMRKTKKTGRIVPSALEQDINHFTSEQLAELGFLMERFAKFFHFKAKNKKHWYSESLRELKDYDNAILEIIHSVKCGNLPQYAINTVAQATHLDPAVLLERWKRLEIETKEKETAKQKRNRNIIIRLLLGQSPESVAKRYNLSPSTIYRIQKQGYNWWQK